MYLRKHFGTAIGVGVAGGCWCIWCTWFTEVFMEAFCIICVNLFSALLSVFVLPDLKQDLFFYATRPIQPTLGHNFIEFTVDIAQNALAGIGVPPLQPPSVDERAIPLTGYFFLE